VYHNVNRQLVSKIGFPEGDVPNFGDGNTDPPNRTISRISCGWNSEGAIRILSKEELIRELEELRLRVADLEVRIR
jgi:hypothetical protein